MRIAYISSAPFSDMDISFISVAQKIMDINYYIIITPNTKNRAAIDLSSLPRKFGIYCGNQIREFKKFEKLLDLSKVFVINYTSSRTWKLQTFIQVFKLYKHIKREEYDIVHITWPFRYCEFVMYRLRKKMILTVHDPFPHSSHSSKIREFERKVAFTLVDTLVLLNNAQKQDFINFYNLRNKSILETRLSRYEYLKIYEDKHIVKTDTVLFFGNILSHKGLDYLLPAMEFVHINCPNAKLIIAGKGDFYFDITPYLEKDYIDIRNRFIPDKELAELIQQCSIVVVPYIDATQSGVVMSAYAFDKPCIATNVGGLPEMVIHGKFGLIVPPKDIEALSNSICKLLNNPLMLDRFSSNIRQEYSNGKLSWEYLIKDYYYIYNNINKLNK